MSRPRLIPDGTGGWLVRLDDYEALERRAESAQSVRREHMSDAISYLSQIQEQAAEIDRLREALRDIATKGDLEHYTLAPARVWRLREIAERALEGGET